MIEHKMYVFKKIAPLKNKETIVNIILYIYMTIFLSRRLLLSVVKLRGRIVKLSI